MTHRWIIATRNSGKLIELQPILAARGIEAIGLDEAGVAISGAEDALEIFDTFEANATAKAEYFARLCMLPCLADDSGLQVDALDGAPGVRSRRFAADRGCVVSERTDETVSNNEVLVAACWDSGRAPPWRARFVCAAAWSDGSQTHVAVGSSDGAILPEPKGSDGFGYDPFFLSDDLGVTFAVASQQEKAAVSHRARAVAALLDQLALVARDTSDR